MDVLSNHVLGDSLGPPRPDVINNALVYLKQFRRGLGWTMDSLQHLAIRSVLTNHQRFLAVQNEGAEASPLKNLCAPVSEKLLLAIENDLELSQEVKRTLALLLANHNTTHLDYRKFRLEGKAKYLDTIFFKKLYHDCPNLKTLVLSHRVWKDNSTPVQCCLLKVVSIKWKHLSALTLDAGQYGPDVKEGKLGCRIKPCQGQSIIRTICKHLPNLIKLDVKVPPLSTKDVDKLSKMHLLSHLRLKLLVKDAPDNWLCVEAVVDVAGRMSSLKKLGFSYVLDSPYRTPYTIFVGVFGSRYPDKKLTLEEIWVNTMLVDIWPQNLSLEELHIYGNTLLDHETILQFKGPIRKLGLEAEVPAEQIYMLTDTFGPDLTHLTMHSNMSWHALNLHRVLFPCKNLEVFKMHLSQEVYGTNYLLSPDHFRNCHTFMLIDRKSDPSLDQPNPCFELIKLYFTGSQHNLKKLVVSTNIELEALICVLKEENQRTCLDRLELIYIRLNKCIINTSINIKLENVPQALVLLLKKAPFLRKVAIFDNFDYYFPPHWLFSMFITLGISFNQEEATHEEEMDIQDDKEELFLQHNFELGAKGHKSFAITFEGLQMI